MKPSRISALLCVVAPLLLSGQTSPIQDIPVKLAVAPVYPPVAVAARASGDVEVMATVDEAGNVASADVTSGHVLLRYAALEATKRWKFQSPDEGKQVRLTFSFRLMPKDAQAEDATTVFMPPYQLEVRQKPAEPTISYGRGDPSGSKHR